MESSWLNLPTAKPVRHFSSHDFHEVLKRARSMKVGGLSGGWRHAAAPTRRSISVARYIKPSARSRRPRLGLGACQGRVPVPCEQMPLWLRQDALPWAGDEHRSVGIAVCTVGPVNGASTFNGECARGVPVMWEIAAARCSRRLKAQNRACDLIVLIVLPLLKTVGLRSVRNTGLFQAISRFSARFASWLPLFQLDRWAVQCFIFHHRLRTTGFSWSTVAPPYAAGWLAHGL